ncbi:ABC transporter permease [Nocardia sp. KC 131]|uniref:ABC transporter permease n=1 Tax=Nocardia arseniciresistens TaxID=3392119 RepID=UPI00398EA8E8
MTTEIFTSRTPEAASATAPPPGPSAPRRTPRPGLFSALSTVVLFVAGVAVLEIGVRAGVWSSAVLPAPSTILAALGDAVATEQFWSDTARTSVEVVLAIVFGSLIGLGAGVMFWKLPILGRVFEPYLVSFYAVPLVLFYPVMIVLVGINATSVVILATIMAAIPMALNTTVGLAGMRPVYLKLARSLRVSPRQFLIYVAIPAAGPLIVAGLRLAVVYALIGSIAMEFTTAQAGLGYRIRYLYEIFANEQMFAHILAVLIFSAILTTLLTVVEKAILRGRKA